MVAAAAAAKGGGGRGREGGGSGGGGEGKLGRADPALEAPIAERAGGKRASEAPPPVPFSGEG